MQPRLKTSQKWTAFPAELTKQMTSVLGEGFKKELKGRVPRAEGRIYPTEILLKITLETKGRLRQEGFEISMDFAAGKDNVLKLLHLGVDAAGALCESFFADEESDELPREWTATDFENRRLFVRFSTENPNLEAEADRLLGLDGADGIARGDWDADVEASLVKAQLGLDEED